MTKKNSILFWVLMGALFILLLYFSGYLNDESFSEDNSSFVDSPNIIQDNFSNIEEIHWGHMPLTYKLDSNCVERQLNLFELAFKKIEEETYGAVSFVEAVVYQEPDIFFYCQPSNYNSFGENAIADALPTISGNLIIRGEINIYGQGQLCNTGYPTLEVHEILHLFNFPHNPLVKSIMSPYAAESSRDCKTTKIDEEYISCLRHIYSNGKIFGECNFPNFIKEDSLKSKCEEGWYEVEGTNWCCPEPDMIIDEDGYCVAKEKN